MNTQVCALRTKLRGMTVCLIALLAFAATSLGQTPAFTFQGRLTDSALPAGGTYQMQFTVYDAVSGGAVVGSTITNTSVTVANGAFTVQLDYSPQTPFASGADRWIEIAVKKPAEGSYTTLTPRQKVTSTPYATKSLSSADSDNLGGLAANTYLQTNGNGSGLTNLNGANITNNTVSSAALAADTFPNNQNLSRLGQLRWDLLGQRVPVGTNPFGVAFDGTNIWVANVTTNNVSKIRASDGTVVATYGVGNAPFGILFDGTNIWTANYNGHNVTKLRASDGANLGTFGVGSFPVAVTFDGSNVWVANYISNNVTKLRASDGANLGTFGTGSNPQGIAFDGTSIWVTNFNGSNVTKLLASTGANQGTFAVGTKPRGIAYDGANIWVANYDSHNVTKLRASDGSLLGTFAAGLNPYMIAFDGTNIWATNQIVNTVSKLRLSDGAILETFAAGNNPIGIAFDGANMWVSNHAGHDVIKLPVFK
ncbi:MAG: hypothetical protein WBO68_12370 [Pyrinomonadaceae bacterium]